MVVLDIYAKSIKNVYKTTLVSKATFFVLLITICTFILPFVIIDRSRGFWLHYEIFHEQPSVKNKYDYLIYGITDNKSNIVFCNSIKNFEQLQQFDYCNFVTASEFDFNKDGRVDEFIFDIEIALPRNEKLKQFTLLLPIYYELKTICPLKTQSLIIYQKELNTKYSEINIASDLKLFQKYPLHCKSKSTDAVFNFPVILDDKNLNGYDLKSIIHNYKKRNLTIHLENIYETNKMDENTNFKIKLQISVPQHHVYYKTNIWQKLKWALLQYLMAYFILAWFTKKITNYIFENNLVLFYKAPVKNE